MIGILRKFDMKISHICPPHLSDVATLPWEIQKNSFSTVLFIHTFDYLCYLSRKQTVIHLPTPPENVTSLTRELQNFCIWLKVCCILSNVGGTEKKQLWCVATGMSGKQRHGKCSEWQPSALIHASSLFFDTDQSHSTPRCAGFQPMSQHVHINTRAPPVACPRRSTRAMQIIGSTKPH